MTLFLPVAYIPMAEARGFTLCSVNYIVGQLEVPGKGMVKHAWNRVKVDGQWQYFDVANDDTTGSDRFYGLSESEMGRDHFPEQVI